MTARIELSGKQGSCSWGLETWRNLLRLMQTFGWKSVGTKLDPDHERSHTFNPQLVSNLPPAPEVDRRIAQAETDWSGSYLETGHSIVSKQDALAMADVVARSLDDIPNDVAEDRKSCMTPENDPSGARNFKDFQQRMDQWTDPDLTKLTAAPLLFLSGPKMKERLREFIAFCRADGFVIA